MAATRENWRFAQAPTHRAMLPATALPLEPQISYLCHKLPLHLAPVKLLHYLPAVVGLAFSVMALGGCGAKTGNTATYTQTVTAAPVIATVTQTIAGTAESEANVPPAPSPRRPITLRGSGIGVHTADLSAGGYTATWTAIGSTGGFTAAPVNADGSLDYSPGRIIVSMAESGTVAFQATGPTTFQIGGAEGPWTLAFTPMS